MAAAPFGMSGVSLRMLATGALCGVAATAAFAGVRRWRRGESGSNSRSRGESGSMGYGSTGPGSTSDVTGTDESTLLLGLLYAVAADQARREGFVHRSITCNHCGASPIRGIRFKCANCVDYDLCEGCEALDVHPRTHAVLKIRIPIPPLANPRSALLGSFYPVTDSPTAPLSHSPLAWDALRDLQARTHFDQVELEASYDQFLSLATAPRGITKEVFEQCLGPLGMENNLITERIFAFFDADKDMHIGFGELVHGLSILCKGSLDERIKYAFQGYDLNDDGFISRTELHRMFKAYFHLSMELVRDVVKTMEEGLMEGFDDEASKPVSASFTAPIPSSGINHGTGAASTSSKGKDIDEDVTSTSPRLIDSEGLSRNLSATRNRQQHAPQITTNNNGSTSSTSRTLSANRRYVSTANSNSPRQSPLSPLDVLLGGSNQYRRPTSPIISHQQPYAQLQQLTNQHQQQQQGNDEERFPLIEAMSQDALVEMVDKTFSNAGCADKDCMTFEEFQKVCELDANLLSWFEALGSVF